MPCYNLYGSGSTFPPASSSLTAQRSISQKQALWEKQPCIILNLCLKSWRAAQQSRCSSGGFSITFTLNLCTVAEQNQPKKSTCQWKPTLVSSVSIVLHFNTDKCKLADIHKCCSHILAENGATIWGEKKKNHFTSLEDYMTPLTALLSQTVQLEAQNTCKHTAFGAPPASEVHSQRHTAKNHTADRQSHQAYEHYSNQTEPFSTLVWMCILECKQESYGKPSVCLMSENLN